MGRLHLHFTVATIIALVGAVIAVAVAFGTHITPEQRDSILKLAEILGGVVVAGGAAISATNGYGRIKYNGNPTGLQKDALPRSGAQVPTDRPGGSGHY